MTLAASQKDFMAQVLDEDHALPDGWSARHAAGLAIYRNNYRTSLVEALRSTYERTASYVCEEAFRQAAVHHLITHPPKSWTLDRAGDGFPDTLRELFKSDPEVAELGWLEAAMQRAFVAADAAPLDAAGFAGATALFTEDDWSAMQLAFLPGTALAPVEHDIPALWRAVDPDGESPSQADRLDAPMHLLVWREGLKPVFRLIDRSEGEAMAALLGGTSYGDACAMLVDRLGEEAAIAQAGAMLGRWLHDGLIESVSSPAARG
ncbi:HvfC/BufC N-terminal domain-containing protein [Parerythrobacter lacustris]|uniref:DNA-binding domain-containing protein n=1 Tax=Parerythrobacter lacustris TaxID=2969984 RepID=A0ABT1XN62_9SPHN|nr:DNA-binding domain-containing protein [Parerythrobacter lacustris]MCR2832709.1 DNA-binding domain-containing protein [Parerythrobacter lacustris]